jgi:hypothetical protein
VTPAADALLVPLEQGVIVFDRRYGDTHVFDARALADGSAAQRLGALAPLLGALTPLNHADPG